MSTPVLTEPPATRRRNVWVWAVGAAVVVAIALIVIIALLSSGGRAGAQGEKRAAVAESSGSDTVETMPSPTQSPIDAPSAVSGGELAQPADDVPPSSAPTIDSLTFLAFACYSGENLATTAVSFTGANISSVSFGPTDHQEARPDADVARGYIPAVIYPDCSRPSIEFTLTATSDDGISTSATVTLTPAVG